MLRILLAVLLACATSQAAAQGVAPAVGDIERFGSYGSNYLLLGHRLENKGWAGTDEQAIRAHYSFRYVLLRGGASCGRACWEWEAFGDYTGEFDFYWNGHDTRPSGPVINRISNPGGHLRWRPFADAKNASNDGASWNQSFVELGFEHESNGQVTEVASARDAEIAQRAYDDRYRPYFDTISRGSNFFALGAAYLVDDAPDKRKARFAVGAKLRVYTQQDYDVTWGPKAGTGSRLSDYHRLQLVGRYRWPRAVELDARWTVGDKGLKTDSFDIGATLDVAFSVWGSTFDVPLYLRYHRGPLNTLSNYTQRQDSIGFGLRLASF